MLVGLLSGDGLRGCDLVTFMAMVDGMYNKEYLNLCDTGRSALGARFA